MSHPIYDVSVNPAVYLGGGGGEPEPSIVLSIEYASTTFTLTWTGGTGPYSILIGGIEYTSGSESPYEIPYGEDGVNTGALVTVTDGTLTSNAITLGSQVDPQQPTVSADQNEVDYSTVNVTIAGYDDLFNLYQSTDGGSYNTIVAASNINPAVVTGLEALTNYSFKAESIRGSETGALSNPADLRTKNAPLQGISLINLVNNGNSTCTVTISYTLPASSVYTGGQVLIDYRVILDGTQVLSATHSHSGTPEITGLTFAIDDEFSTQLDAVCKVLGRSESEGTPSDEVYASESIP